MMGTLTNFLNKLRTHPAAASFHRHWNRLPPFLQHLVKSLVIGVLAATVLHAAKPYVPGLAAAETAATDWAIKFWQDRQDSSQTVGERYVFIDIDAPTFRAWGEPLFVPRDKLLHLIRYAAEAPAKMILVDIELAKHVALRSDVPPNPAASPAASASALGPDEALAEYLRAYASGSRTESPHILFARTIQQRLVFDQTFPLSNAHVPAGAIREERASEFLEGVIGGSRILHWASALSDRDEDGLVRNWRLFEATCLGSLPRAIPSMALLAWAILRSPEIDRAEFAPDGFQREISTRFAPPAHLCQALQQRSEPDSLVSVASWVLWDPLLSKPLTLSAKPSDIEQRIFYKFHSSTGLAGQFSHVSARLITERVAGQSISLDLVAGTIVIIGTSHERGEDIHFTPIGEMPGPVVLLNQLNALLEFGQFREVSRTLRWTGLLALIIVFSLSFSLFTKTWGAKVSSLVVNVVLLPLSLWLFQYGWWLDLVFPLFVLQAYQRFVDIQIAPDPVIRRHRHAHEKP